MRRAGSFVFAAFAVLLLVGIAADLAAPAIVGFFGVIASLVVLGAAAGGDWIREVSARRFRDGG